MKDVRVYSTLMCPYCVMAKRLLEGKGVRFEEIRVDQDQAQREEMMRISGRRTVPQIFVGDTHVGGFDELSALERAGKLDPLLQGA
ncbi:MAG: glutaredoxin 3 [Panacagrimonas sp.]